MNFALHIKTPLIEQFNKMSKSNTLYRVNVTKDELWNTYLNSFPQGSNEIYKTRTYHDCNCCKSFIRSMGNVVSITDQGKIESIWDISSPDPNNINQELNMDFKDTDMQAIGKNVIQSNEELLDPESQFYSVNYGIKEGVTPEYRKGRVTGHEAFHNFGLKHNRKNNSYESKGIMSKHVKFIEISKGNTEEMVKKNIKNITLEK